MLVCVLLKKDVGRLVAADNSGGSGGGGERWKSMVGDLMAVFCTTEDGDGCVRRQIGFVVAEICASLTLADVTVAGNVGLEVMRDVLARIEPGVSFIFEFDRCLNFICIVVVVELIL